MNIPSITVFSLIFNCPVSRPLYLRHSGISCLLPFIVLDSFPGQPGVPVVAKQKMFFPTKYLYNHFLLILCCLDYALSRVFRFLSNVVLMT